MDAVEVYRESRIRRALKHLREGTTDEHTTTRRFAATDYTDPGLAARNGS